MLAGLLVWFLGSAAARCGDAPALTEPQVKALCLFNFAKYVEWPADAFALTNSPIIIGTIGDGKVADELEKAVKGKAVGGREFQVVRFKTGDDVSHCKVLFVSASEKDRFTGILAGVKGKPVLTVGEDEGFRTQGGIMNFVNKDGKVRFKVNLESARAARLQISSKLLSLAEEVSGKP